MLKVNEESYKHMYTLPYWDIECHSSWYLTKKWGPTWRYQVSSLSNMTHVVLAYMIGFTACLLLFGYLMPGSVFVCNYTVSSNNSYFIRIIILLHK